MAAVTPTNFYRVGPTVWYFEWTALGDGVFAYVFRNGRLLAKTLANFCLVPCETAMDVVEIFDSVSDVPSAAFATSIPRLEWERVSGATSYIIKQYIGSTWTQIGSIPESGLWRTWFNATEITTTGLHQYRVIPVVDGAEGIPQTFSFYIVAPPPRLIYTAAWDNDTGLLSFANV